ncbi:hypothetical protein ACJ41O_013847 [Fusarium nematophilum]
MVELFLKGTLTGPCLHGALQDAISEDPFYRDDSLIKLLLKYNADINYNDGAGLHAIITQKDLGLLSMLMQNASPQTAAARVADVMKTTDHRARHDMMAMLFSARASVGVHQVAEALLATLSEKPVDMSLLHLILQQGRADINNLDGQILKKAVQNPDPKVIDLVLSLGKQTTDTIPCYPGSRQLKPIVFGYIEEATRVWCNPNAYQARPLCSAVAAAREPLVDIMFGCEKAPTAASLAVALPHALSIPDPMNRLSFTKRLVESGAQPREVNRALNHAIGHFTSDFALISILAGSADASDGEALAMAVTKESPEILDLLLSRTKHSIEIRNSCLEKAMKITDWTPRLAICSRLAKAGVSPLTASNALLIAARDGDLELGDILIAHGASISTNDGQAIIEACRGGSVEVLDVLLRSNVDTQKLTLERGFQAATEVRDLNKRAMVFQRLLHRGVSGEVVDIQLVSAAKYGEEGQEILRVLLAAGADPNYSNGEAVVAATRSAFVGSLELLLGLWHEGGNQKKASPPTLIRALKACWKLSSDTRFHVVQNLMKAGMPAIDEVHIALSKAVGEEEPDERLIKLLLDSGASPLTNSCYAIVQAVQGVKASTLELLLDREISEADINQAFSTGFSIDKFKTWFSLEGLEVARILLEKGATGDALSGALVMAMKDSTDETEALADQFVELFVAHGADVDFGNGEPLVYAASKLPVKLPPTAAHLHTQDTVGSVWARSIAPFWYGLMRILDPPPKGAQRVTYTCFQLMPVRTEIYAGSMIKPEIPDEKEVLQKKTYEYQPVPLNVRVLQIPAHELLRPGPHLNCFWRNRFPKKRRNMLLWDEQSECLGWGIHIVEDWNKPLANFLALLTVMSLGLFVTVYGIVVGDWATGATIGSFLVTVVVLYCTLRYQWWVEQ